MNNNKNRQQIGFTVLKAMGAGGIFEYLHAISTPFEDTAATIFGTAVHTLLAGEEFDFSKSAIPDARLKAGCRPWKDEDIQHARALVKRANELGFVPAYGEKEKEFFVDDIHKDFIFRAKPDVIDRNEQVIYDYKTCACMSDYFDERKFCNLIVERFYHVQLAYYAWVVSKVEGWYPQKFCLVFLCSKKVPSMPRECYVKRVYLSNAWIDHANTVFNKWIKKLIEASDNNFRTSVDDFEIRNLAAPGWLTGWEKPDFDSIF